MRSWISPRTLATAALMVGALGAFSGCDLTKDPPLPPYEVVIHVESDPGVPLPGAIVSKSGKDIAKTGPDGRATITMAGNDGETSDFNVSCPVDFTSPVKPISVTIRRLAGGNAKPEYTTNCTPNVRKVVVAVRADGGPNLPITYLGKPVGKTDSAGAAHLLLAMKPGDQFQLGLDTTAPGLERMRPESPAKVFVVKDADDIQVFDIKFTLEKLKPVYHAPPKRPHRIDAPVHND